MRPSRWFERVSGRTPALVVAAATFGTAAAQGQARGVDIERKTTVVVMPFEFAAPVPAQSRVVAPHRPPLWPPVPAAVPSVGVPFPGHRVTSAPVSTSPYPAEGATTGIGDAIGTGVADLLVERLLDVPGFRVVERRRLDLLMSERRLAEGDSLRGRDSTGMRTGATMLRARYIITGSVTRFGTEERRGLGAVGGGFGLGALGFKRPKTQVALTARIIDAATGEVVASMTGAGTSTKGGSVLIGGIGGGAGGGVALGSSEFRASALGEATNRAVDALVAGIVAKRERMN